MVILSDENVKEGLTLKLLGPAAEAAGETLKGVWETVFGKIDLYNAKKNLLRTEALEDFKMSLGQKVIDIPPEALREPKLSILGPTLEASKYYFEEEPLRDMFASLAAASMDRRKERDLHPSYPEIIKQMSPLDAKNLSLIHSQTPIAEYRVVRKSDEMYWVSMSNVFLENENESDLEQQSRSLASLARLGLIQLRFSTTTLSAERYEKFYVTDYFLRFALSLDSKKEIASVEPGVAEITPLGKAFISVCLS